MKAKTPGRTRPPNRQDFSPPQRDSERLDLLSPADVARLGGIEITTRSIVDGFLAGLHRSPRRGFSVEFAEHRPYQRGDEPRYIDWKLLGRTDRLHVKQFEEETNLRAMLLLDTSASMAWQGADSRLTKLDFARRLLAAIALLLLRQRDAVGLLTFDSAVRQVVPPRVRRGQWHLVSQQLGTVVPGSETAAEPALRHVVAALRRRGLVIFCSDLLVAPAETRKALRFLRHRGHDVMVAHIVDPAELELPAGEETRFRDPESGQSVTLSPTEWAAAYRTTVERVFREWGAECRGAGMGYAVLPTDLPFGAALGRVVGAMR